MFLLGGSLFASFFITLWLTSSPELTTATVFQPEALKTIAGTNNADLLKKLSAAGFRANSGVLGNLDEFAEQAERMVHVSGWAFDQFNNSLPLTVSVYVDGESRLSVRTAGPRDDVAKTYGLPESTTKNIAFSGTFHCETTGQAVILAINPADGRYTEIDQRRCPFKLF